MMTEEQTQALLTILEGAPNWNYRPLDKVEEGLYRSVLADFAPADAADAVDELLGFLSHRPAISDLLKACRNARAKRLAEEQARIRSLEARRVFVGTEIPPELLERMRALRARSAPDADDIEQAAVGQVIADALVGDDGAQSDRRETTSDADLEQAKAAQPGLHTGGFVQAKEMPR